MTLLDEERFSVNEKTKLGIRRSRRQIYTWINCGLRSRVTGEVVKLEALREGREIFTSREALKRFFARLNGVATPDSQ